MESGTGNVTQNGFASDHVQSIEKRHSQLEENHRGHCRHCVAACEAGKKVGKRNADDRDGQKIKG